MSILLHMLSASTQQRAAAAGPSDVTPDSVNWGNISDVIGGQAANSNQTISGIDTTISLKYSRSGDSITLKYRKNSGSYVTLSPGSTFTVSNGDTVNWQGTTTSTSLRSGTITVINESDGDTTLDTFTYSLEVFTGGGL